MKKLLVLAICIIGLVGCMDTRHPVVKFVASPNDAVIQALSELPDVSSWALFYNDVSQFHFTHPGPWSLMVNVGNDDGQTTKYEFNMRELPQLMKDIEFLQYVLKPNK